MKKRVLSILLTLVMVIGMLPTVAHAAVGEIVPITAEELLEVMEVDLRIGHTIIANDESTSFSKMSGPGWELELFKQDNANRMQYYIRLHLSDYDVPDGHIAFLYDMKPTADTANSVSFQVLVHGDCQVGFIRALTTDKEKVYGSSLDIFFEAGATLRTEQIVHQGTGQWGSDIELNLRGTPGEEPGILYTKEIMNHYYFIDWPHDSEPVTYANDLIIINYGTPLNDGPLFKLGEDKRTYKVRFNERVDLFLNTHDGLFPIFGEYADATLEQTYQYIEDDGITAFSDLRPHIWLKESGLSSTEYTVGDSIDYYFFPELTMLDFLFKTGINEQFKGDTTSGFKVESSYTLTNLTERQDVASGTVTGIEKKYSHEEDNFVKVAGKYGEDYFTFETPGLYELRSTVKLMHNGHTVDSAGEVYHFLVNDKPLVTPTITQQPESVTSATGDSVTLTAKADNATRARWYVEKSDGTVEALGDALTDGTSTQTISKASNAVGNRYFCAFWSVDNKIAKTELVTVCFAPTVNGSTVTVNAGQTAYLKVTASGCNHYAEASGWYAPGASSEVSGSKYYPMGTTLCVSNVTAADAGVYTYKYVTEHDDVVTGTVELVVNTDSSSEPIDNTIDTFDIFGLQNPMYLGTPADMDVTVPADAKYEVTSMSWTGVDSSNIVTSSDAAVTITLTAKDDFTFNPNSSGTLAGLIDNLYAADYSVSSEDKVITVYVQYRAPGSTPSSAWNVVYPENDTISISTDSLTFKAGTAANGQKVEGAFECTHSGLADTNLHHTGMKYAVYSGIADNEMPAGLTLNADGTITGTPTTAGVYTVMVRADSVNASGTASNCSGLAVKAIEIVVESDAHIHDWDLENPVSDSATCTADGEAVISCKNDCGETITITSPAKGHTESSDWSKSDTEHWKVCSVNGCGAIIVGTTAPHADDNSDNKCDTCGYDMTPTYTITYTDGVDGVEVFADQVTSGLVSGAATPAFSGTPTRSGYTFTGWTPAVAATVTGNQTYTATWDKNSTGGGVVIPTVFPVTVKESDNGEVEASAKYAVPGSTVKLTVTPDEGYELDTLIVKSGSKFIDVTEKNGKYQFVMPFGSATVTATFKKIETPVVPVVPTFDDVAEDTYYFDAVEWAVENGITTGTSDTTFSPDLTCTRAQAVTFLWRAAGSPEPKSNVMPFEDVAAEAYYYKAVLWAVENGITKGTSATTFSPDADCTRAQIVTFLWRAQKSPAADSVNPFTDVAAEAYYVDAVLWAVENGITKGTSETTFSPDADCTRAQIVTFLYRALNEQ